MTLFSWICYFTTENRKHVNCAVPCSESVEMVEPMLSVRIRSKPCTESCSRRRLRKRCSLCSCSLTLTAFLSCSSSFCKAHVSTDQNTKNPSCMICINLTMQTARNKSNQWKQYKNCKKLIKAKSMHYCRKRDRLIFCSKQESKCGSSRAISCSLWGFFMDCRWEWHFPFHWGFHGQKYRKLAGHA